MNGVSRSGVLAMVVAAGVMVMMAGAAAQQSNFMGGNPTQMDAKAIRTLRLKFPAGSRSNWHSHSHGQLLMIEEGKGRTQERGGPLLEMTPGAPWHTKAGVEHWHGADPAQDVVQLTIYEGEVKWLEPVTDAVYKQHRRVVVLYGALSNATGSGARWACASALRIGPERQRARDKCGFNGLFPGGNGALWKKSVVAPICPTFASVIGKAETVGDVPNALIVACRRWTRRS